MCVPLFCDYLTIILYTPYYNIPIWSRKGFDFWDEDQNIWEFPGNYPYFTVEMVIYHYVERIVKL